MRPENPNQVRAGDAFPELHLQTINGEQITIPDPAGAVTHLQLTRFAGCPICNLHLHSVTERRAEIESAGIREVIVFHSTLDELLKYQDDLPFPTIADPDRLLYRRFGVEHGARSILNPRSWRALPAGNAASIRTAIRKRRAPLPLNPNGGNLGLPADILIGPDSQVIAAKCGRHAYDQWTVDELLSRVRPSAAPAAPHGSARGGERQPVR